MKIHRPGDRGQYVNLGCRDRFTGGTCNNTKFYRADKIEQKLLPRISVETVADELVADPIAALEQRIKKASVKATDITAAHVRSLRRTGEHAKESQATLEADYTSQREEVRKLDRQLATLKATPPAAEIQRLIGGVLGAAPAGDVNARTKIAATLPAVVESLRRKGSIKLSMKHLAARGTMPAYRLTWTTELHRQIYEIGMVK
jgi:hypothetical protein